jgi:hypothetical protein
MPMIGHLGEAGVVVHDEFREGTIAPASRNLEFIKDCETHLPKGHRTVHVRMDSADYQANVLNDVKKLAKPLPLAVDLMSRSSRPSKPSLNQAGSIMPIAP